MLRLAIIDDEEETRQIMVDFIDWETYGISVIGEASDGFAAYELINTQRPDIVLIDIQMPGMTGLEVLEKIRQEDVVSPAFIIISGYDDFDFARKALSLSAVDYLLKPFRPDDVILAIQRSIRHLELIRNYNLTRETGANAKALFGSNPLDFSLLHYPSREEHHLLDCLRTNSRDTALISLRAFMERLCELNASKESQFNCAIILYVEICRFLMERGACFQKPYFDDWDGAAGGAPYDLYGTLEAIILEALSLVETNDISHIYVNSAMQYIKTHYNEPLSLENVANAINLSAPYLSALFSKVLGTTFINYIQSIRIEAAKELLRSTTLKVYEVAYQIGYDDEKYFSQVFRKAEGISPSQFRSQSIADL